MATWIFQCNPSDFDIDGYLEFAPERISWTVKQEAKAINPGDQVFFWRAAGNGRYGQPGIVAECSVASAISRMAEDPGSHRFWRANHERGVLPRVWLKPVRVADPDRILERSIIAAQPGLKKLGPINFTRNNNYPIDEAQARELNQLWQSLTEPLTAALIDQRLEEETARLQSEPLETLRKRYLEARASAPPRHTVVSAHVYERSSLVCAIARKRADFRCEIPDCESPPFIGEDGWAYCEVHHITPLEEGGADTIENAACVCPNHHRELHFGQRRKELAMLLLRVRRERK